jgi:5-methylcytosine-specific restriction enzyme A
MKKPCIVCGALYSVNAECPKHPRREAWRQEKTASERGYDHAWAKGRRAKLNLEPDCQLCGAPATEVDHIRPLRPRDGGPPGARLAPDNLMSVCGPTHRAKHARERSPGGSEERS